MKDPHTQESRGFGFVKMVTPEQADAAKEGLQGEVFEGRTLSIEKARRARPRTPTPGKYFGPPKRGQSTMLLYVPKLTGSKMTISVALLAVTMTAVEVEVTVMITTVDHLRAMMIENAAPMVVATITPLVALIAMLLRVGMIATAVVEMTVVVAEEVNTMVARAVALGAMATQHLQGKAASHTEVESMITILMIGIPVDRLRSADLVRCGALCQITRPRQSIVDEAETRQRIEPKSKTGSWFSCWYRRRTTTTQAFTVVRSLPEVCLAMWCRNFLPKVCCCFL